MGSGLIFNLKNAQPANLEGQNSCYGLNPITVRHFRLINVENVMNTSQSMKARLYCVLSSNGVSTVYGIINSKPNNQVKFVRCRSLGRFATLRAPYLKRYVHLTNDVDN